MSCARDELSLDEREDNRDVCFYGRHVGFAQLVDEVGPQRSAKEKERPIAENSNGQRHRTRSRWIAENSNG